MGHESRLPPLILKIHGFQGGFVERTPQELYIMKAVDRGPRQQTSYVLCTCVFGTVLR